MANKRSRAAYESDNPPQHAPYAIYGTPLSAYDPDARDDGSYVPIWKQEVTDERGRKRLHGAFTGGFSAGYFNTVGSKEGWTPSTFVSSRSNRHKDAAKKVEDFMDDEDLVERAESQKLETQGAFAGLGSGGQGGSGKGMFADLFRTTGDSMGVKLLQRMGWRQGQGIGPKVRRRATGDRDGETHMFAPANTKMISFLRKTDRKGIGFAGEEKLNDPSRAGNNEDDDDHEEQDARILQTSRSKLLSTTKKPALKKTGGFGTGILNDTGSDDEDDEAIVGPRISYNRVIGGEKIKSKKKGGLTASNAVQKPLTFASSSKKLDQRTSSLSGFRKCHDGRLPLDGFVLTSTPLVIVVETKYPPPEVPEGWKPANLSKDSSSKKQEWQSTADAAKASILDAKSRANLLGEQQLPGKSVFDFISPAARDRLAAASGRQDLPQALGEKAPEGYQKTEAEQRRSLWDLMPDLDQATAEAALARGKGGFMPYAEDEGKRSRYTSFLSLKAGQSSTLPPKPSGMSTDDWTKEMREFAKAAEVFRPISALMASRFTSSASTGPRLASDAPDPSNSQSNGSKEEDPAIKAANLGMFGPGLTRTRTRFFPTRLLCKRFNVKPPPNVDPGTDEENPGAKEVVSQASLNRMMQEANWGGGGSGGKGFVSGGVEGGDDDLATKASRPQEVKLDVERNEALEGKKAGADVFKAIFGDGQD